MVIADTNKYYCEKASREGVSHGLQDSSLLADNNHRFRKNLIELTFLDVSVMCLVVRFSGLLVVYAKVTRTMY